MSSAVRRRRHSSGLGIETLETRILFATLPANFTENIMGGSITNGTNMYFAPDGRLFVTQQTGQLRVVDHGVLQATPFTTVPTYTTVTGERGLLGIAFDPDYFNNHYVYVYYTALTPAAHNRVSRFTADPNNPNVAIPGSETVLLDLNNLSSATNHNGGSIHFGPDGKLYIVAGENANRTNAQSFANLLGKMLRMNKDGTIPTDNPYFNDPNVSGQNKLIWSLGLRNPFTFAFQNGTGRMFINDVGENTWEEIDDGIAHSNYGWGAGSPTIEGFIQGQTPPPDYRDPLFVYGHVNGQIAIIGGAFYNPVYASYPASYVGQYFFSDLGAGWIHTLDVSGASPVVNNFATGVSTPSSIQLGPDGSIYYLQRGGTQGAYRIRYADSTAPTASNPAFVFDEAKPTFGTPQRLRVQFSEYVGDSLTPSDLVLVNQTTGQTVPTANISLQYDASTNIATFSFPGFADANGVLPDGNYHATIAASAVTDVSGNPLSGGMSLDFYALNGDLNRDRHVDAADQAILTAHLNQSGAYTDGDLNYDGTVNAADQAILTPSLALWLPPQSLDASLPATSGDDAYVLRSESAQLLDVTYNNAFTPTYRIYKGAPSSVQFSGGNGNDSMTLDYSNGTLLRPPFGMFFDGGADIDTLTIIGMTAPDTYEVRPDLITNSDTDIGPTNVESIRLDGRGGFDTVSVLGNVTSLTLFNPQHLASLSIAAGSNVAVETGGNSMIVTRALSLASGAALDLNDNDLILDYSGASQLATVQQLINTARANGAWTGAGLTSSTARNIAAHNTTLGAMEATDYKSVYGASATFDGEPLDNDAILVKYTYYGDSDFNGQVNFDDYVRTDNGFNNHLSGWLNGDFDGNGAVNFDDYVLLDLAFNTQGGVLARAPRRGAAAGSRAGSVH